MPRVLRARFSYLRVEPAKQVFAGSRRWPIGTWRLRRSSQDAVISSADCDGTERTRKAKREFPPEGEGTEQE
jgi:hypothetical protein